jgi:hypothetical protein
MIKIVNAQATSVAEAHDPGGERLYELSINHKLICDFKHRRKDGLAECLRKAANAADIQCGGQQHCIWRWDYDGYYKTGCNNMFQFTEDGIRENSFRFCPYCGKPIEEAEEDE